MAVVDTVEGLGYEARYMGGRLEGLEGAHRASVGLPGEEDRVEDWRRWSE